MPWMMRDPTAAQDALDARKMKDLPDLAVRAAQSSAALAKMAADRAAGSPAAKEALARAEACLSSLIALETALMEDRDAATMMRHISQTLSAAAAAVEAAAEAVGPQ